MAVQITCLWERLKMFMQLCITPTPIFCKKSKFANTCSRKLIFTHQMLQNFRTFCFVNYVWNCSLPLINIFQTPHCFCILTFVINYSPVFVFKFIWNSPPPFIPQITSLCRNIQYQSRLSKCISFKLLASFLSQILKSSLCFIGNFVYISSHNSA